MMISKKTLLTEQVKRAACALSFRLGQGLALEYYVKQSFLSSFIWVTFDFLYFFIPTSTCSTIKWRSIIISSSCSHQAFYRQTHNLTMAQLGVA